MTRRARPDIICGMRVRFVMALVLRFLDEHWAALVVTTLVLLTAFYFAPRGMFEAMIAAAIIGTGVAIGHWWA